MKSRSLFDKVAEDQSRSQQQCHAVQNMGDNRWPPHFLRVYARDQNLAIRKFQQSLKIGFDVRKGQALRHENNRAIIALQSARQGIIVTDRVPPLVHDTRLLEGTSTDGRASAPTEISALLAEHSDQRRIPRGEERCAQIAAI